MKVDELAVVHFRTDFRRLVTALGKHCSGNFMIDKVPYFRIPSLTSVDPTISFDFQCFCTCWLFDLRAGTKPSIKTSNVY